MIRHLLIWIGIFTIFQPETANAQIVNIESARMQSDTTGWKGSINAGMILSKQKDQVFGINGDAHLQYKSHKNLYLVLVSYSFLKGAVTRYIDNAFYHLRFNTKLNKSLRWELFTQYQENKISNIRSRYLLGTGPRFKLTESRNFKLYTGFLTMFEYEKETFSGLTHQDMRSSNYLSFTFFPLKNTELVSTLYFQPLYRDLGDYRILHQALLKVKANKQLSMQMSWNFLFDTFPAVGAPGQTYSFSSGFSYGL